MTEDTRHEVRPATPADRDRLARTLAAAFADDPAVAQVLPHSMSRREDRLRRMFAIEGRRSERLGGTWTSADGSGAAIWFPPGRWDTSRWEDLLAVPAWLRVLDLRQSAVAARLRTAMSEHHRRLAPHWYLLYLGTEPARQGQGVGSALLRAVLDRCDAEGSPAYLEATCERNRDLYLRHGFRVHEVLDRLPDDCPPLWAMWRDPH